MAAIAPYLRVAVERKASDLYIAAGAVPNLRIEGRLVALGDRALDADTVARMADEVMSDDQRGRLASQSQVDFASDVGGFGRFRVNVFRTRGRLSMVWRYVHETIPTLDELALPPILKELVMLPRGLVLMVGATGSGKSTTLAAMVDHRNRTAAGHLLTIEDPIEFLHEHKRSIVNQREVGEDVASYAMALQAAMREAADLILIGEVRTRETMDTLLQLSNTGHLAIATLHANNAYQTLQRISNLFPNDRRDQLRMDLSLNLRAIISQRLVPTVDGRRIAAVEVLLNTPYISELIMEGRFSEVREAMADSSDAGMQTFDDALLQLHRAGRVAKEDALSFADSRGNLENRINFGV